MACRPFRLVSLAEPRRGPKCLVRHDSQTSDPQVGKSDGGTERSEGGEESGGKKLL